MSDQEPQNPADAYFEMVEMVGAQMLFAPAPLVGREVVIVGKDGVNTSWELSDAMTLWLRPKVLANKNVRWVSERRYARVAR